MKFLHNFIILAVIVFCLFATGCASLLPRNSEDTDSVWKKYSQVEKVYNKIVPDKTTVAELATLGINPKKTTGIEMLTIKDIVDAYIPNSGIKEDYLDQGVIKCLKAKNDCYGYKINPSSLKSRRKGNWFLDTLELKRITETKGWNFRGMLLLVNDTVVYKERAGGYPFVKKMKKEVKPLGLFSDGVSNTASDGVSVILKSASGLK